jgi:hypothetical protein
VGRHDVARERLDQRIKERRRPTDAVSERRALQGHPLAGVDLRLPIQRQVIGVLGHQDVRQEPRTGNAACDRPAWRRFLDDLLAARAGELRTHVPDHLEARRDVFQDFGDVLADLLHRPAAVGAGAGRGVFHGLARQAFG